MNNIPNDGAIDKNVSSCTDMVTWNQKQRKTCWEFLVSFVSSSTGPEKLKFRRPIPGEQIRIFETCTLGGQKTWGCM